MALALLTSCSLSSHCSRALDLNRTLDLLWFFTKVFNFVVQTFLSRSLRLPSFPNFFRWLRLELCLQLDHLRVARLSLRS